MQQISTRVFSDRKVSIVQAIKILKKNGIETNEKQVKEILDFLYLLAKMHSNKNAQDTLIDNTTGKGYRTSKHHLS
ncbi:PTS sugar transporter subunit IIBC [Sphingobacterium olei]|uniref:PTS sugar transporter subunit IIBC n=1 Tax=Sphingobacterium olei TaxID=2571155 RepID=A0A4U0NHI4_9SPHI|nr:PTS sugar transporter subunit IIBC [Sphingobacterium olei]